MNELTRAIKTLALSRGAARIGVCIADALRPGPPSADPAGVFPGARTVVSYAVALDAAVARDFLAKRSWRPHCEDRKRAVKTLYEIGDALAATLREAGFRALDVAVNNNYLPEEGAADVSEMTEFHPEFSHRYAAVAAGIGRLGWSGNLMTAELGALVELGSVISDAPLTPDAPLPDAEHPCDGCRSCSAVCPVGMVPPRESAEVTIGSVTERIAAKRPNTCCWIGCTGYEGRSADGEWSNWSPYTLGRPLPAGKSELDELCIALQKADPQMREADNSFSDYRRAVFDSRWFYHTVCGFCRSVCFPGRRERIDNRRLVHASGRAALRLDGEHVLAGPGDREIDTPFGLRVTISASEVPSLSSADGPKLFPLDREVLRRLQGSFEPGGA